MYDSYQKNSVIFAHNKRLWPPTAFYNPDCNVITENPNQTKNIGHDLTDANDVRKALERIQKSYNNAYHAAMKTIISVLFKI